MQDGPLLLKVKNTFLDVDGPVEEDCLSDDNSDSFNHRQVSAPVFSLTRQTSPDQPWQVRTDFYSEFSGLMNRSLFDVRHEEQAGLFDDQSSAVSAETLKAPQALTPKVVQRAEMVQDRWHPTSYCAREASSVGVESDTANMTPIPDEWAAVSTAMLRNLPSDFSQRLLLDDLKEQGFLGGYDFVYLPLDPVTKLNRGYAFVNFVSAEIAWSFCLIYDGRVMGPNSNRLCVTRAALQGFDANHAHHACTRVSRCDPEARPLFFRKKHPIRRRRRRGPSMVDMATKELDSAHPFGLNHQSTQALALAALAATGGVTGMYPLVPEPCLQGHVVRARLAQIQASKVCHICRGEVRPDYKFCQGCGVRLV